MFLWLVGLTFFVSSYGFIPPSNVFYQHTTPRNACAYGNLTVAFKGKVFKPKDCGSPLNIKDFESPPVIYINSTNTTERFTVVLLDLGPDSLGPPYLQWMVTNVSINTLPDYTHLRPGDTVADYKEPLRLSGTNRPNLIQILVFRHQNVLRVPFGELFIVKRSNFDLSQLFSNTGPNLKLCGPVAGTQYWLYGSTDFSRPSAPPLPPGAPGYVLVQPLVPNQPLVPVQPLVPSQSGYVPSPSGYVPPQPPLQPHQPLPPNVMPVQHPNSPPAHPHQTFPKKNAGYVLKPANMFYLCVLFGAVFF